MNDSTKTLLKKILRWSLLFILWILILIFVYSCFLVTSTLNQPSWSTTVYDFWTKQTQVVSTGPWDVSLAVAAGMFFTLPFQIIPILLILLFLYPAKKAFVIYGAVLLYGVYLILIALFS